MTHIIGKAYELNAANMNKLIAELEAVSAERDAFKAVLERIQNTWHDDKTGCLSECKLACAALAGEGGEK